MAGVAIGVAVLIVVLSVMNGFEHELRVPHPEPDLACHHHRVRRRPRGLARAARETLKNPQVTAVTPFVEGEMLLIADRPAGASSAATLRGIDPELEAGVSVLHERLRRVARRARAGLVLGDPR